MIKRSSKKRYYPNFVNPPGGKVDLKEDPFVAASREILEETGLMVKNVRLEAVVFEIKPVKNEPYNWLVFQFSGDYKSGKLKKTSEGELLWFTKDELIQQNLIPAIREIINQILNPEDGTIFATFHYDKEKKKIIKRDIKMCLK